MKSDNNISDENPGQGNLLNKFGVFLLKGLSYLPFWFLYGLSDFMKIILQYVVKYRKTVVLDNLRRSFPEKNDKEITQISGRFYRHLCDTMIETIKGYSMSAQSFNHRLVVRGAERINEIFHDGKSIILLGMHYNNWEWSGFSQQKLKHRYMVLYNPMRGNPDFEKYLLHIRTRWGAECLPVHKSARTALGFHQAEKPILLALGADQRPPRITKFWTLFMNQEACFNSGPLKIAIATRQPVFFHLTRKIKRGHYEVSFIPMYVNPEGMKEEEILLEYVRLMEKFIAEAPEYYLWSHKRWKQKRPEDYPLF